MKYENLLDFYIDVLKEINENYKIYPTKRIYRIYRLTEVCKYYLIHTNLYRVEHKGILLDLIQDYYRLAINKRL